MIKQSLGRRLWAALPVLVVSLALGLTAGPAFAVPQVVHGHGDAAAAKKKKKKQACKKKKKKKGKRAGAAKKCKKPPSPVTTPVPIPTPIPTPSGPPPPTLRATLSWSTASADLDLYVWDQGGALATGFLNEIPSSQHSPDALGGPGTETFTDLLSPSNRVFTFGVCAFEAPDPTDFSLTFRLSNGVTIADTSADYGGLFSTGDWGFAQEVPGGFDPGDGGPDPPNWCVDATD